MSILPGLKAEIKITVKNNDVVKTGAGEKLPPVLGSPRTIALMEHISHMAILPYLTENQTSVVTFANIRHLAATPMGMEVHFRTELKEIDDHRLLFNVEAWDNVEKVSEGEIERVIIDLQKFTTRMDRKAAGLDQGNP